MCMEVGEHSDSLLQENKPGSRGVFHPVWKSLASVCLACCVFVTLVVGSLFFVYSREILDFSQVLFLVYRDFRLPLSVSEMLDGAIRGLAESSGDRHTYYLTPEQNKVVNMSSQGLTGAIGVTIDGEEEIVDRVTIRAVQSDSGAEEAGLKVNDGILRVDGTLVMGLTVDDVISMIRGIPNTYVDLLIARMGEEPKEYRVRRSSTITVETVESGFVKEDYLPGYQIGYIYIDYFAGNTWELFNAHLDQLLEQGAQALVLDLRFNGGGDVAATAKIAGRLLPGGALMKLVTRNTELEYRVQSPDPIQIPYAILVNGSSASASEILAGAVQDRNGGILVGTRTYGKGSVQSLYNLPTGSGLRVTEGLYQLPGGRSIDGEGILPDVVVQYDAESEFDVQTNAAILLLCDILDGRETMGSLLAKIRTDQYPLPDYEK